MQSSHHNTLNLKENIPPNPHNKPTTQTQPQPTTIRKFRKTPFPTRCNNAPIIERKPRLHLLDCGHCISTPKIEPCAWNYQLESAIFDEYAGYTGTFLCPETECVWYRQNDKIVAERKRRSPVRICAFVREAHWEGFLDVDEFEPEERGVEWEVVEPMTKLRVEETFTNDRQDDEDFKALQAFNQKNKKDRRLPPPDVDSDTLVRKIKNRKQRNWSDLDDDEFSSHHEDSDIELYHRANKVVSGKVKDFSSMRSTLNVPLEGSSGESGESESDSQEESGHGFDSAIESTDDDEEKYKVDGEEESAEANWGYKFTYLGETTEE